MNVDPIEKKPFFHVLPGTNALSIATAGLQRQLQVLPELGDLPGPARTGPTISTCRPRRVAEAPRSESLSVHRLHLHRADGLLRVHVRHGRRRPGAKAIRSVVVSGRPHQSRAARSLDQGRRRHQDRPQGVHARNSTRPMSGASSSPSSRRSSSSPRARPGSRSSISSSPR